MVRLFAMLYQDNSLHLTISVEGASDGVRRLEATKKWLGCVINPSGIKEQTKSTIINETVAIIEDSRLNRIGATKSIKEIFELAILPALLNNAELFMIHDNQIQKTIEEFQYKLWRSALQVPKSCPLPALIYESNSWLLKYKIYSKILNYGPPCRCSCTVL